MTFTKAQQKDLETIEYFIPSAWRRYKITDEDRKIFLNFSEKGIVPPFINGRYIEQFGKFINMVDYNGKFHWTSPTLEEKNIKGWMCLMEGKRWRGIHIHEMYEEGVLDGSMPYFTILGGYDMQVKRKWWQFWKPKYILKHNPMPRSVVDFLKKEMFKGQDAEVIERCYQDILRDK